MTKKYVWLNIENGMLSNSWNESDHSILTTEEIEEAANSGYKLIQYECLNDEDFELCNLMRLR